MSLKTGLAAALLALAPGLFAVPITVEGQFIRATFTDRGVLSSLIYDPTGTRTFEVPLVGGGTTTNDYVSPGTPFEGFGIRANNAFDENRNSDDVETIPGVLSGPGGNSGGSVTWTGSVAGAYNVTHVFSFSNLDQRITITTTITALNALADLQLSRAVDPDPDLNLHGTFSTVNQRGLGSIPQSDIVFSEGSVSGLPLGLLYQGPVTHNVGISQSCCGVTDPAFYLGGGDAGDNTIDDNGIGIAFSLGNLAAGQSTTISYAYVMGTSRDTIDTGVPEPGTIALVAGGLLLVGLRRRRSN